MKALLKIAVALTVLCSALGLSGCCGSCTEFVISPSRSCTITYTDCNNAVKTVVVQAPTAGLVTINDCKHVMTKSC